MRDACDAGKFRVVRTEVQHANLFTKPLDIQKFRKQTKLRYTVSASNCLTGKISFYEAKMN